LGEEGAPAMSKKQDSEIKVLILAKSLYVHGCTHASQKDSVSRMLAIHHFDNAVEMVLRCVATKQGIIQKGRPHYFEDFLEKIEDLPLDEQMRGLHRLRNDVQHQGDIPSTESVIKYKSYTEDFLSAVCGRVFNVPYEELFLGQLVESENLRERLRKAEEAFGRQEFKHCITLCNDALLSAVFDESDIFSAAGTLTGYWGASEELRMVLSKDYPEKYKGKDYYDLARELQGAILQWGQAATSMQFLGDRRMDFLEHMRIVTTLEDISEDELRDSAESSLDFVISIILEWQEKGLITLPHSV
jgi:hypothetical protein